MSCFLLTLYFNVLMGAGIVESGFIFDTLLFCLYLINSDACHSRVRLINHRNIKTSTRERSRVSAEKVNIGGRPVETQWLRQKPQGSSWAFWGWRSEAPRTPRVFASISTHRLSSILVLRTLCLFSPRASGFTLGRQPPYVSSEQFGRCDQLE